MLSTFAIKKEHFPIANRDRRKMATLDKFVAMKVTVLLNI